MPNRILRDWTDSEKIDQVDESSEVVFVRLIMKADDHGCFTGNLKLLKASLFPLRDTSVSHIDRCLNLLAEVGLINRYKIEGKSYLQINDFGQRLRTMKSKFPLPSDNLLTDGGQVSDIRPPETKRNEVETNMNMKDIKIFGSNNKYYFNVDKKYVTDRAVRVNQDGLKEYMEANQSVLNLPAFAEKFMRKHNGAKFNDFMHVFNAYNKFTENGNA